MMRKSPFRVSEQAFPHAHKCFSAARKSLFHASKSDIPSSISHNALIFNALYLPLKTRVYRATSYTVCIQAILSDFTLV